MDLHVPNIFLKFDFTIFKKTVINPQLTWGKIGSEGTHVHCILGSKIWYQSMHSILKE